MPMMSANTFILARKATLVSLNGAFADICVFGSFSTIRENRSTHSSNRHGRDPDRSLRDGEVR